jgi:hypothetical protein
MIIAWDNLADDAALAASSELNEQPASYVQDPRVSRKWGTASAVKSATLLMDLGSTQTCALLALLGLNLTTGGTYRLRGSITDSTGVTGEVYDSGTLAIGLKVGYGAVYKSFTAAAARYWLLNLDDTSVPDNLEVGRVFLGPKWTPTVAQQYGWSVQVDDPRKLSESVGGQIYADERPQKRVLNFELAFLTEAEMYANAFAMARANGTVRDVLAISDDTGTYVSEQAVYGLLTANEPLIHERYNVFRQKYQIRERL